MDQCQDVSEASNSLLLYEIQSPVPQIIDGFVSVAEVNLLQRQREDYGREAMHIHCIVLH